VGGHFLGNEKIIQALPYSTPFAGGVGGTHDELCGGLTGGLMVIGGIFGRTEGPTPDQNCQDLAAHYKEAFLKEFGWLNCGELKQNWVGKAGQKSCRLLVQRSARILTNIIQANS
jgi:C_GCAxxG_C_C family probable redox protein